MRTKDSNTTPARHSHWLLRLVRYAFRYDIRRSHRAKLIRAARRNRDAARLAGNNLEAEYWILQANLVLILDLHA